MYGGGVTLGPDCLVVVPGAGVAETRMAWTLPGWDRYAS